MTNNLEHVISYESLLILETGEEVWYVDEIEYDKSFLKVLSDLAEENKVRNVRVIVREISDWLI